MKKILFVVLMVMCLTALAQDAVTATVAAAPSMTDLFTMFLDIVKNFKTVGTEATIAAICYFIIAASKNSFIAPYWYKIGKGRVFIAPILTLIATVIVVHPLTIKTALAALGSGVLAQLIDVAIGYVSEIKGVKPVVMYILKGIRYILGHTEEIKKQVEQIKAEIKA